MLERQCTGPVVTVCNSRYLWSDITQLLHYCSAFQFVREKRTQIVDLTEEYFFQLYAILDHCFILNLWVLYRIFFRSQTSCYLKSWPSCPHHQNTRLHAD